MALVSIYVAVCAFCGVSAFESVFSISCVNFGQFALCKFCGAVVFCSLSLFCRLSLRMGRWSELSACIVV